MKPDPYRCPCQGGRTSRQTGSGSATRKRRVSSAARHSPGCELLPAWCCRRECGQRAKILEGPYVAFQKCLRRLGRKCLHKAIVGLGQIKDHEVRRLLNAGNNDQGFTEIGLRFAGCMPQRHEHLLAGDPGLPNVVLHDGVAARVCVLGLQPLKDAPGRVPLLLRPLLVFRQKASIKPCHAPSLGRRIGACRRYPGGSEYSSILFTVFRASPNSRATARRLLPSARTARRTRAYISTVYIPPVSHGAKISSPAANLVRYPDGLTCAWMQNVAVDYFYPATSRRSAAQRGLFFIRRVQPGGVPTTRPLLAHTPLVSWAHLVVIV